MPALFFWATEQSPDADLQLAHKLKVPLVTNEQETGLYLTRREGCLVLGRFGSPEKPVAVDVAGVVQSGRQQRGKELLVKAVGGGAQRPTVVDATAGLGRDGFILASHGYPVTLVEREPVLAALLQDALWRAEQDPFLSEVAGRLQLVADDAQSYLQALEKCRVPDVIYLDPMFAESGKSARVKKDLRLLQDLLPASDDADSLLELALNTAHFRVVVKRALKAQPLAGRKPSFAVKGKAIRFDVYALQSFDKRG